jgi:peroxiredoxin
MKIYFLLVIFFIFLDSSFSQTITVKVNDLKNAEAFLYSFEGEKASLIDSVVDIKDERIQFKLDKKHPGFYRLIFNKNRHLDFIYDKEDIEMETDANLILDSLKILKSNSNKIYYEFIKLNKAYKLKTELLQLVLSRYPKEDDYYILTKEKLVELKEKYLNFVNITSQEIPNSFVSRYVRSAQLSVVGVEIPLDEQLSYLKEHTLDNVNFYDDGLIYSDVFTNKTIEYLSYYKNPQLSLGLLEKEFMKAVDTLLNKAKVNEIVYKDIVEYLLDGFKKFGFDNVINYIVENYVIKDDLCLDEKLGTTLERRIDQAKYFKIGSKVPNIILPDSAGMLEDLSKINTDNTLIIFYASWCPHCKNILPKLYELYESQKEKKFEVFAISIDTVKNDWLKFIRNDNLNWINVSDLKGWKGAALNYYIYATPTMFLINREGKIILKPSSVEQIRKLFN